MIQDSVYLITGGGSGLGKATAEMLLSEGASVTIIDLQIPAEDSVLRIHENKVLLLQVDVTSEKDVLNAIDATKRKFGKLNGVISCAGIAAKTSIYNAETKEPLSLQEFTKAIDVNLIGTFNVTRLAVPLIIQNEPNFDGERGVVINTSSIAGHRGSPKYLAYSISKAGVVGMTRPLAVELSEYGIRVLDIAPGVMDTPMIQTDNEAVQEKWTQPLVFPKRKGKPSEFAHLVKAIIENPMLNGTSIRLDGCYNL